MTGCHTPQTGDIIGTAEATIKAAALASITAKYPSMGSSDLKFNELCIGVTPGGNEGIDVSYDVPASAKTTTEGKKTTTTTKVIGVFMSLSGEVESVYENTRMQTHNAAQ